MIKRMSNKPSKLIFFYFKREFNKISKRDETNEFIFILKKNVISYPNEFIFTSKENLIRYPNGQLFCA